MITKIHVKNYRSLIDLDTALPKSRSLRRLEHAVAQLIENRNDAGFVSPL